MNRYALCLSVIALVLSGAAHAADKDGRYTILGGMNTCGEYLGAYAAATLTDTGYTGPHKSWEAFGFINGYITAYNRYRPNGKQNILASMSNIDAYRWIASWCRDNPSKNLFDGFGVLIVKLGG